MINELITYLDSKKYQVLTLLTAGAGNVNFSKQKKDLPYGVGLEGDCKGNTYTYDDRNEDCSVLILKICNV